MAFLSLVKAGVCIQTIEISWFLSKSIAISKHSIKIGCHFKIENQYLICYKANISFSLLCENTILCNYPVPYTIFRNFMMRVDFALLRDLKKSDQLRFVSKYMLIFIYIDLLWIFNHIILYILNKFSLKKCTTKW